MYLQPQDEVPGHEPTTRELVPLFPGRELLQLDFVLSEKKSYLTEFHKKHFQDGANTKVRLGGGGGETNE